MVLSVQDKPFSIYSVKGCLLVILLFLLVIGISGGIVIAKTGLIEIPVLSKVFYRPAAPTRQLPAPNRHGSGREDWPQLLANIGASASSGVEKIVITEDQASQVIRSFIEKNQSDNAWRIEYSQVVFLDNQIELYARLIEPRPMVVKLLIEPVINNNVFAVRIKNMRVGGLSIPSLFLNTVIQTALRDKLDQIQNHLRNSSLQSLTVTDGQIEIEFKSGNKRYPWPDALDLDASQPLN